MIDFIRAFNLNGRQLLYTRLKSDKTNNLSEKTLYEINNERGKNSSTNIKPIIKIMRSEEGDIFSYENLSHLDSITAQKNKMSTSYTVSVPSKEGKQIIGYIKDDLPIAWTKDKNYVKLLKKLGNIVAKGSKI